MHQKILNLVGFVFVSAGIGILIHTNVWIGVGVICLIVGIAASNFNIQA